MDDLSAAQVLEIIREENSRPAQTADEARRRLKTFYARFHSDIPAHVEQVVVGSLTGYWIWTDNVERDEVILFFHGGGFVVGSTEDHRELCVRISKAAGCRLLSIDYRLAPESPFPAALEDCVSSYQWLNRIVSPARIIPIGVSAGGSLLLSMFMRIRDIGLELPRLAVCICPAVNLNPDERRDYKEIDDWLLPDVIHLLNRAYVHEDDVRNPLISPYYGNLADFPPLLIQIGTRELLYRDAKDFASKARKEGVDCSLEEFEGMFHCWHIFSSVLPQGREAIDSIGLYIKQMSVRKH